MNAFKITQDDVSDRNISYKTQQKSKVLNPAITLGYLILGLLLLWIMIQRFVLITDPTAGYLDPNIWLLALLSLIFFLIVTGLCWWLLQQFWMSLGFPGLSIMVLQFKTLELWQQLKFYWASFALLLLAAIGVLVAIC